MLQLLEDANLTHHILERSDAGGHALALQQLTIEDLDGVIAAVVGVAE